MRKLTLIIVACLALAVATVPALASNAGTIHGYSVVAGTHTSIGLARSGASRAIQMAGEGYYLPTTTGYSSVTHRWYRFHLAKAQDTFVHYVAQGKGGGVDGGRVSFSIYD